MTDQEAVNSLAAMKSETDTVKSEIIAGFADFDSAISELESSYSTVSGQVSSLAVTQLASLETALAVSDGA